MVSWAVASPIRSLAGGAPGTFVVEPAAIDVDLAVNTAVLGSIQSRVGAGCQRRAAGRRWPTSVVAGGTLPVRGSVAARSLMAPALVGLGSGFSAGPGLAQDARSGRAAAAGSSRAAAAHPPSCGAAVPRAS